MNLNFALTLASYLNPALNNPAHSSKNCKRLLSELTSDASPLSHRLFSEVKDPGGYSIYPWVGKCGAAPHTLTLFKTNIADFPTLFKTEFRFLIP